MSSPSRHIATTAWCSYDIVTVVIVVSTAVGRVAVVATCIVTTAAIGSGTGVWVEAVAASVTAARGRASHISRTTGRVRLDRSTPNRVCGPTLTRWRRLRRERLSHGHG